MHHRLSIALSLLVPVVLPSVVKAEDVTIYVAMDTRTEEPPAASVSLLGVTPISVDDAGATHYAWSHVVSSYPPREAVETLTATFEADATRYGSHETTTMPMEQGGRVIETDFECVHDFENDTSLCENKFVEKRVGNDTTATITLLHTTYTARPSAWVTISNVILARPSASGGGSNDEEGEGGEEGGARGGKWLGGAVTVVAASIGLGAVLVLA